MKIDDDGNWSDPIRVIRHYDRQLVGVLRRLIRDNDLHARHGEDTIGVLTKCGAFHEAPEDNAFVTDLAKVIDSPNEDPPNKGHRWIVVDLAKGPR